MEIDYKVYYFSCNLKHVLYNIQNAEDKEKSKLAKDFEDKYIENLNEFIIFFNSIPKEIESDYNKTWDFIKENNNSGSVNKRL